MKRTIREIALDTETTGLDPEDGHRIVEIGCVEMMGGIRTGKDFHVYINPERDMPPEAERVHGLSAKFLSDKPLFKQVVRPLVEFLGDAQLVIHNAAFDMKFLNAELLNAKQPPLPAGRAVDTVAMAKRMFPGSPASLDALCKRFGIDTSKRTYHGALLDAELLADVYLELTGGRQNSLWQDGGTASTGPDYEAIAQRYENFCAAAAVSPNQIGELVPSPEEISQHQAMLSKLKNPLWLRYMQPPEPAEG